MTSAVSLYSSLEKIVKLIGPGQEFVSRDVSGVVHPKTLAKLVEHNFLSVTRKIRSGSKRISVYQLNMDNHKTFKYFIQNSNPETFIALIDYAIEYCDHCKHDEIGAELCSSKYGCVVRKINTFAESRVTVV